MTARSHQERAATSESDVWLFSHRLITLNAMRSRPAITIDHLPNSPGVYLFYGAAGELLYVGKSKAIRSRVRAHFSSPNEKRLCRQVRRVEARNTAGELGALLLESQLIKDLKPLFNIRSRQKRRIIIARRVITEKGYYAIELEAITRIDPANGNPIMGIFKTKLQAHEYLSAVAKEHTLCPKLLGLERTTRFCFSFHLHLCNGACMGLEDPHRYNNRLELAFEERRIKAWPYEGGIIIEERSTDGGSGEVFVVDNWCLLYSFAYSDGNYRLKVQGLHRFDYDSYRILAAYIFDRANKECMREASREEVARLVQLTHAA